MVVQFSFIAYHWNAYHRLSKEYLQRRQSSLKGTQSVCLPALKFQVTEWDDVMSLNCSVCAINIDNTCIPVNADRAIIEKSSCSVGYLVSGWKLRVRNLASRSRIKRTRFMVTFDSDEIQSDRSIWLLSLMAKAQC